MWGKKRRNVKPGYRMSNLDSLEESAQQNENWADAVMEGGHHCDRQTGKCGLLPDRKGRGYCAEFLEAVGEGEFYKNPDGSWTESGAISPKARNQGGGEKITVCPFCGGHLCPPTAPQS